MISLFDYTTNMAKPWADAGYRCHCFDLQHPDGGDNGFTRDGNIYKYKRPIEAINWHDTIPLLAQDGPIKFIAAFPPCTDVSISGARWFKEKGLRRLAWAIKLFAITVEACELSEAPYMIENPVSVISSHYRKPDYIFHPYEYGDPWTKKTCLWTGNGFKMPKRKPVYPTEGSKIHKMAPSEDRGYRRSITPMGFAKAAFEANRPIAQ